MPSRRHAFEKAVDATLDVAERMIGPNAVFDAEEMEQRTLIVAPAAHDGSTLKIRSAENSAGMKPVQSSFSAAC